MKYFVTGGSGFLGGALISMLTAQGDTVTALARTDRAAATVTERGATAARGDLDDAGVLKAAMAGADVVVHAAAMLSGRPAEFHRVNVEGTANVLAAADGRTVVYVSTEQVIMAGPLVRVDETAPYPARVVGPYARTKQQAERAVLAAGGVAVRPRMIWGRGDTTLLPAVIESARSGRLRWIGGGHQQTSTCHVRNVATGIVAAATRGTPGEAYFLTDGPPVEFRSFWTRMLATQGVAAPTGTMPRPVAMVAAAATELTWRALRRPGQPPLDRMTVALLSDECTVNDAKARATLGYAPAVTIDEGLADMSR